jgi:hypothetical protein
VSVIITADICEKDDAGKPSLAHGVVSETVVKVPDSGAIRTQTLPPTPLAETIKAGLAHPKDGFEKAIIYDDSPGAVATLKPTPSGNPSGYLMTVSQTLEIDDPANVAVKKFSWSVVVNVGKTGVVKVTGPKAA